MFADLRCAIVRVAGVVAAATLFVACASAPVQEMSDARQAVMAAEQTGAEDYAPESLSQARNLLARAQQNLRVRSFDAARDEALGAKELAIRALRESQVAQRRPARDGGDARDRRDN